VQPVPPENLTAEPVLSDGIQALDRLSGLIQHAEVFIDGRPAFRGREVGFGGTQDNPGTFSFAICSIAICCAIALGSIADKVVRTAPCPVLTIGERP
jgi:hypothetical protein